ncbi:pantoate--beta-alanine ligase [Mucilaginibacter rubeus]|uniref:Pantothenate synthetase n=1 Tax=Mucilaginibacter rubeus TaxID=2027860 RepID=A0AAE6JMF1_9SPHI|nr:pantoate--beta-alanine ligase [Mucilaginibacter rubeus]QEM20807.1 pantoate--beta-alanine ligase [Mucilaginibacter gossypii]QTE46942.1 pantoate--beta-alanine ligase [Mucilaginibacter rubeus]QTE53544.1 pantoate--beta-alanine ligase [Mucilaginibacter rubeus]QTE60348.1 pantoate--beta-alanine ligase [Mucilaginibacter rubeus]
MKIFSTKNEITDYFNRKPVKVIGFVPTMGALHKGHLGLIELAKQQSTQVVCSIFVNPTQFNDPKDLEKYPRPITDDIRRLEEVNCDILFNPQVTEMYADNEKWHFDMGDLEYLLEGKFRPGHYQGVTQVVNKLFNIVKPDIAFFGQKDYQQFMVINKMVEVLEMPVKLVMCPIEREPDGLAMSSRNIHLTPYDREHSLILSKALNWVKENFDINKIDTLQQQAAQMISNEPGVELEYFEIADGKTLHHATPASETIVALVAARVGKTRLIDNVLIGKELMVHRS